MRQLACSQLPPRTHRHDKFVPGRTSSQNAAVPLGEYFEEISHSPLRLALARFLCTIETGSVSKPDRRGSTSEGTVRLGAVCAEPLKRRARRRAQFSPRTQHAFTQHEWRIHHHHGWHHQSTAQGSGCFSALGLAGHESCQQDPQPVSYTHLTLPTIYSV